ncbi:MAG: hypothetical protein ABI361_13590 [Nitrososphaera sp.]
MPAEGGRRFANPQQKKFYLITRYFRMGNIIATAIAMLYFGKHFFGVGS